MQDWKDILYDKIKNEPNKLNDMKDITLSPAEYRSLLVIKMNAELLALTSNEQYRELVINLIKEHDGQYKQE